MVTNLGLTDARALEIQADNAREGNTLEIAEAVAEKLIKRGWAVATKDMPKHTDFSSPPKPGKPNA